MGCSSSNVRSEVLQKRISHIADKKIVPTQNYMKLETSNLKIVSNDPIFDSYKIIEKSKDENGDQIFKVQHKATKKIRGLKIVQKDMLKYQVDKTELNEISIMKVLDHPNVIKTFEFRKDKKNFYIVTEYLSGADLYDQITKLVKYSEKDISKIMEQLLYVLSYLHSKNIVYRDLRPSNISLIIDENGELELKLSEFGAACFIGNDYLTDQIGSPYYMAPEVVNKSYDQQCDIWSAGVILYVLLSGKFPFEGATDEDTKKAIMRGKFEVSSDVWKSVSKEGRAFVMKLLEYDPEKRYSAEEALKDEWFQKEINEKKMTENELRGPLENIRNFHQRPKLVQSIVAFLSHHMASSSDELKAKHLFRELDINRDGKLSYAEMRKGYETHFKKLMEGTKNAEVEFDLWISSMDQDKNGYIDYDEFLRGTIGIDSLLKEKNLRMAFDFYDKDNSGYLSTTELKEALGMDKSSKDPEAKNMMKKILSGLDENGDKQVSFDEFKSIFMNIKK